MNGGQYLLLASGGRGSGGGLPPIPSRWQLCSGKNAFQGLWVNTPSFGRVPWTDGVWTSPDVTAADRQAAYAAKRLAGDTIATFNVSWAYREGGVLWNPAGADLSSPAGLITLKALVREAVVAGFFPEMTLAGDGLSHDTHGNDAPIDYAGPWVYNDPVGDTYGWQWLMHHFQRIYDAFGPTVEDADDLRPYMRWRAGYDGMIAWQPWELVDRWLMFARSVIGHGVLCIELPGGFWAWSGETDDYAAWRDVVGYGYCSPGDQVDVVQQEYPPPIGMPPYPDPGSPPFVNPPWDPYYNQVLQISKRLLGPHYRRPPGLPSDYDPGLYGGGPLAAPTTRGARSVQAYEIDTYLMVRGRITDAEIAAHARYLQAMGYPVVSVPDGMLA